MASDFTETLSVLDAQRLLGEQYNHNFIYTLITLPERFVINAKDKKSGEETEIIVKSGETQDDTTGYTKEAYTSIDREKRKHTPVNLIIYIFFSLTVMIATLLTYLSLSGKLVILVTKVVEALVGG